MPAVACTLEIPGLDRELALRGIRRVRGSWLTPAEAVVMRWDASAASPAEAIRSARLAGRQVVILVVTGDPTAVERALDAGADDAVSLPVEPDELAARVAARLAARRPF